MPLITSIYADFQTRLKTSVNRLFTCVCLVIVQMKSGLVHFDLQQTEQVN